MGLGIASTLSIGFTMILGGYFCASFLYTVSWKEILLVDVLSLSMFHLCRLWAGAELTGHGLSHWFILFSFFFFCFLGSLKRISEMLPHTKVGESIRGRPYLFVDVLPIVAIGSACLVASLLIFALYVDSKKAASLYERKEYLLYSLPLLFYWMSRLLIITCRGQLDSDPVVFALKDRATFVVWAVTGTLWFAAWNPGFWSLL